MADLSEYVVKHYADKRPEELPDAPVVALKGVSQADADCLKRAFDIDTIRDLATNRYVAHAQTLLRLAEHPELAGRGERGVSGTGGGGAMTRSEEELEVGTERRATGEAVLRKRVETERVEATVPVTRERVKVEREPITGANRDEALTGAEITEAEHRVRLHAEEPVTRKTVVPKERVRLGTEEVTEEATVTEDVRKERIEVDERGDG